MQWLCLHRRKLQIRFAASNPRLLGVYRVQKYRRPCDTLSVVTGRNQSRLRSNRSSSNLYQSAENGGNSALRQVFIVALAAIQRAAAVAVEAVVVIWSTVVFTRVTVMKCHHLVGQRSSCPGETAECERSQQACSRGGSFQSLGKVCHCQTVAEWISHNTGRASPAVTLNPLCSRGAFHGKYFSIQRRKGLRQASRNFAHVETLPRSAHL